MKLQSEKYSSQIDVKTKRGKNVGNFEVQEYGN
jgi:hypothetical protein